MPVTPLHYGVAYLIGKWKQSLSLSGLIVGSVMPDTERLVYLFIDNFHARGFLHSLFGVATLGTVVSVLFTVYAYPAIASSIFRMDKETIKQKCHFSKGLVLACFVGGVFHVIVDSLHHEYNPTLYPFISESFDALVLFGDWQLATIFVQSVLFVLFITIIIWEAMKETKGFWKRVLVG
ncbi:MAG: DUF4184 family protein [Candidatus Bathyarchaeota archaeon]|nr:MAG: DUF4184 family protein [Candidatus Bathyarchaeota archaeon]